MNFSPFFGRKTFDTSLQRHRLYVTSLSFQWILMNEQISYMQINIARQKKMILLPLVVSGSSLLKLKIL